MNDNWHPRPGQIPTEPGVYRFFDENERVLYVGKAKNLRNRLSSYFRSQSTMLERTARMVRTAKRVDWTVVGTEVEALHLEFTWIKQFKPPFNIQFRDDKGYPYLAFSMSEEYPRAFLARDKSEGTVYFGPYTKAWAVRETLELLLTVFPVRSCTDGIFRKARKDNRPCLLGEIGKCAAPCIGKVSSEENRRLAEEMISYLKKPNPRLLSEITEQMESAARNQRFEIAAKLRDQRAALKAIDEKSAVVLQNGLDVDIFGIATSQLAAAVCVFFVRDGRIRGIKTITVDTELEVEAPIVLEQAIQNFYETEVPPTQIDVPLIPESIESLQEYLSDIRTTAKESGRVKIAVPKRGDRATMVENAIRNAKLALAEHELKRSNDFTSRSKALEDLRDSLGLPLAPLRFECFDVSHLAGADTVGSLIVFEDGLPVKSEYRHYAINGTRDDTESMHQLVSRRISKLMEENPTYRYPTTLLLVDGGEPQVAAANRAVADSGISGISVAGLAKRLEEIWLPNSKYPVILPRNSEALYLVQRARDEAHRFAIRYQKSKRTVKLRSELEDIPGLGSKRVAALLKHFGSPDELRIAAPEQIAKVAGIGNETAKKIQRILNPDT